MPTKILYLLNDAPFFFSHRVNLARAVQAKDWSVHVAAPHTSEPVQNQFNSERFTLHQYREDNKLLSIIKSIFVLNGILHDTRPDLVHVVTLKCTLMWFFNAPFFLGTASVHTLAGFGQLAGDGWKARLGKKIIETVIWFLSRLPKTIFVIQNETDFNDLKMRRIIPEDRIRLVQGSGVNTSTFIPPAIKPHSDVIRIGTAARRLNSKGFPALAMLAHACKEANLPIRFVVASSPADGHSDAVPAEFWRNWLAADLFEDAGHVTDMPRFYQDLDGFIYLSMYGEGLAKTLLEAGSAGLPIITTLQHGCKDAVEDGVTGYICDPLDQTVLLEKLSLWAHDRSLMAQMGEASRALIRTKFSDEVVIGKMTAIYDALLGLDK